MKDYSDYKKHLQTIADINHSIAVLHWDKEVYLPANSARFRSQQIATLSEIAHKYATSDEFGLGLEQLLKSNTLDNDEKRNVELSLKDYKKATKLSPAFVVKKSNAISKAYHAWVEAKNKKDFSLYEPSLDDLIDLSREESEKLGYENHPYDAHLDKYETELNVQKLELLFTDLKQELQTLLNRIQAKPQVNDSFLHQYFDKSTQWDVGIDALKTMGYNMNQGRQDISTHPFTISFSPEDVRVTTRIDENNFTDMFFSCIHEGGHALYEQGLQSEYYGLPQGSAVSLGIHESQSRLWENHVSRNKHFWKFYYPKIQSYFPEAFSSVTLDHFYKGLNKIEPNLIRTEADELHYHLHVIIRYEIEKAIFEGEVKTSMLPQLWNDKYKAYLGINPQNDDEGILQDIHWSHGSFGYFPTYSIGSLYAAQFYDKALQEIGGLDQQLETGNFNLLLSWLNQNIHVSGRLLDPDHLCESVTGSKLDAQYFIQYARSKYFDIYGIEL